MAVVVDANLLVGLSLETDSEASIAAQFTAWSEAGEALHAPSLMPYELASAFTGMLVAGRLTEAEIDRACAGASRVEELHELTDGPAVVRIARLLERKSAYDAAYIALAQARKPESGRTEHYALPHGAAGR